MDLTTTYLGLKLRTPLVPSASPLSEDVDNIRRMEDCGASAVVLHSLFEEQIRQDRLDHYHHMTHATDSFAEALSFFPEPTEFKLGPEEYLDHVHRAKAAVDIPVIASLNGASPGGWTEYASLIEQAGADALELNIYYIPTNPDLSGAAIEDIYIEILESVVSTVKIPVAVKLSPYFTNTAHVAKRMAEAGARGLVLFNRFYQPDINLETLEVRPHVLLSTPHAMRLPLNWIGILYGRVVCDLAATSGIHSSYDVLKMLMAGAKVTMLCSSLLRHGIEHIRVIEEGIRRWMQDHTYGTVELMQGSMSQEHSEDPSAFERAQYARALHSYSIFRHVRS